MHLCNARRYYFRKVFSQLLIIMDNKHPLLQFIRSRPALAASKLGIAPSMMSQFLNNQKPFNWDSSLIFPLTCELCAYGLEVEGWRFTFDPNPVPTVYAEKWTGDKIRIVENKKGIIHYLPLRRYSFSYDDAHVLHEFFQSISN